MGISPQALASQVQISIPFSFLARGYLARFCERGLNPEIGLDAWSLVTFRPRQFREVAVRFHVAGRSLTLHAPFQDMAPGALDDLILAATRRRLRQAWRWLPVFRPRAVVCHLGYEARHYRWDLEKWLARAAATFRELGAQAARLGIALMLENVYEEDPELLLKVIARIDLPNVRVCLDVGHLNAFGGGDFEGWLRTLAPVLGQLHLHDNHGAFDDHRALGTGNIPFDFILSFLAARNLRPLITLEPHQEGSLDPSLAYLAAIWPWR